MAWDPFSIEEWSAALGMAKVPLFRAHADAAPWSRAVLLDGTAASLALLRSDDTSDWTNDPQPLTWAWSSYLRHLVILREKSNDLFLRRWDTPNDVRRLPLPKSMSEASELLGRISEYRPRATDVISQMISAFKSLRLDLNAETNLPVIRTFNLLISAIASPAAFADIDRCHTLADVLSATDGDGEAARELVDYKTLDIKNTIEIILNSAPPGVPPLSAELLIRHASGQLYQEAHFELERQAAVQMSLFGGVVAPKRLVGAQQRDARFTPNSLARSLIEQALQYVGDQGPIYACDPACGSGVFLHELLRELESMGFKHPIKLLGIDSSDVSVEIARFCLSRAVSDARAAGLVVEWEVRHLNALLSDAEWGEPNIILMNPPFVSYRDMSEVDREEARNVLGDLTKGHFDKAMAFIWKAATSVANGGVVASVLPSVLLESEHGRSWREALLDKMSLRSVGRFRGYSYFPGAMVEPAFIVLQSRAGVPEKQSLTVLISEEGSEDAALRALRKKQPLLEAGPGFFLSFDHGTAAFQSGSWMPRSGRHVTLLKAISHLPAVRDVFEVNQGALTGSNDIFILRSADFRRLPKSEQKYFRPAAGTSTIRGGRLVKDEFVFYPYDEDGPQLESEEELCAAVPRFYEMWLKPARTKLQKRSDPTRKWWDLIRHRRWQAARRPKILTAYFGQAGHFAYDASGEFVCVHGYAWQPINESVLVPDQGGGDEVGVSFFDTSLPWAYVAILNSKPFNALLSCFCVQVQGGQFNLSKRYVDNIPIPDLAGKVVPSDLMIELESWGRRISAGDALEERGLTLSVSRAYGVPVDVWNSE